MDGYALFADGYALFADGSATHLIENAMRNNCKRAGELGAVAGYEAANVIKK